MNYMYMYMSLYITSCYYTCILGHSNKMISFWPSAGVHFLHEIIIIILHLYRTVHAHCTVINYAPCVSFS